ncbi:hypothetical protein ANO11243_074400 [Dothideomycetidae sp. 11243]|nr:hypothetical protein ANO11243_074400 [fungal sp. No.11243]
MRGTRHSERHAAAAPPPAKKTRLATQIKREAPAKEATPPVIKQEPEEKEDTPTVTLLPSRTYHSRPLPTLPQLQPTVALPDDEYQSVESSGVLLASLHRSRQKWLAGEFFERYWTKTTGSKKDQKNALPNNPPKAWMKEVGRCTIIVEPLIFEVNVYISKDPAVITATQQQNASIQQQQKQQQQSTYNSQYRPNGSQPNTPQYQNQPRPFVPSGSTIGTSTPHRPDYKPPMTNGHASPAVPAPPAKQSPDPVIQLLASRASTDRNLKELMKIVATGTASAEQLRTFQQHIDELNAVVAAHTATKPAAASPAPQQQQQQQTPQATPRPPIQQRPVAQALAKKEPIKPPFPVLLEFADPGASQDRFLFPPYSIVEALGSYSILASFLVLRKGGEASATTLFDPDTEYYEPVTVKIDVVAGTRSVEVLEHMKRSVKPADEVRKWMEEQIQTKKRADMRFLPLRLPHESQLPAEEEIIEETPPAAEVKKRGPYKKKADREREQQEKEQQEKEQKDKEQKEREEQEAKEKLVASQPIAPATEGPTASAGPTTTEDQTVAEGSRRHLRRSGRHDNHAGV